MMKPLAILLASAWIVDGSSLSAFRRPILDDDSSRKRLLEHCSVFPQQEPDEEGLLRSIMTASRRRVAPRRKYLDADVYPYYRSQDELEIDALHRSEKEEDSSGDIMGGASISPSPRPIQVQDQVQLANRVQMWPPWPLNLLTNDRRKQQKSDDPDQPLAPGVTAKNTYPSAGALFWVFFRQQTRVGLRQLQEVGSELWFHLPPAAPPLILWTCLPRKITIPQPDGTLLTKRILPIWSNPLARNLALAGTGFAILSWAHMEVRRKRQLTPLPLTQSYTRGVSKVFLPPVLPEDVPEPELEALNVEYSKEHHHSENQNDEEEEDSETQKDMLSSLVSPKLKQQLAHFYEKRPSVTLATTWREWKRVRAIRRRQAAKLRRMTIFDELVALQALKRHSARYRRQLSNASGKRPGYALVTGASQGIGRAIAIELARWDIPLILVARDLDRLTSLAYDLEACYGVQCCVLQADLAKVDAAEKIYQLTHEAGLPVDILINNAGIAYDGLAVDMDVDMVERMVMLNTMAYAKLSKLYGQDMKRNKRGRILMVSSMSGIMAASPNSALYGATKAFEKSLGLSMAKEMEPYGVGVTCLMPGPVVETQFRDRSGTGRALCWYLPYYPRPAQFVAHIGVMSMLDGDTQAIPGWQNRAFVKIFRPILPQRVEIMAVQAAWSPFKMPSLQRFFHKQRDEQEDVSQVSATDAYKETLISPPADLKPRYSLQLPPRLLKLPEPEPEPEPEPTQSQEPESEVKPKPSVHEDEGSSSSRVGDPIDHQSIHVGETIESEPNDGENEQKTVPAPVEESLKQPVNLPRLEAAKEEGVEEIEKNQGDIPTSKPGGAVGRVEDKKEAAETEKPADKPVEKPTSPTSRRPTTIWMDDDQWGGLSPRIGSTDDFFERRLRLLNRKGAEATTELERQLFLA